jgi:hypothetical protein
MPAVAGNTYRGYRYDGVKWNKIALTDPAVVYPTQSGNNGKFLTTNGAVVSWTTVPPGEKGDRGDRGETGAQGVSVTLQGTKATIADLPAAPLDPNDYAGHGWIVTTGNGSTHLDGSLWFWNLSLAQWDDIGLIVGPQGDKGDTGDQGPPGDQGDLGPAGTTDYNELSNTPQNVSDFTNDVGYITATDRLFDGIDSVILRNGGLYFPDNTGQTTAWLGTFSWDDLTDKPSIITFDTVSPTDGVLWYNPNDGRTYIKYNDVWVDANPQVPQETFSGDYNDLTNLPGPLDRLVAGDNSVILGINGLITFPEIEGTKTLWAAVDEDFSIRTTRTDPGSDADINIYAADDLRLYAEGDELQLHANSNVLIYTDDTNTNRQWTFGQDGNLTLPNGMTIDSYGTSGVNAFVNIGGDNTRISIDNDGAPPGFSITTNAAVTARTWRFGPDGELSFPDATVQTTAWTGTTLSVSSSAPTDKDFWFNTTDGRLYLKDNSIWVDANPQITPETFSGDYNDLTNQPNIFSGDYNDLDNLPSLFSGDYEDLTNTPSIPTDLNQLNNSSGFITGNGPSISNPTISFDSSFPLGAPSLNTSSTGTRFKLWPQVSSIDTDYAIGMDSSTMWFGIPNSGTAFKWYSGVTKILQLSGNGGLTFADNTTQTTAWTGVVDYNSLINKPTIPAAYTFNVAADDSTLREISADETVKFIGAGGITTASDDEGAITITQGSTDQIIKVAGSFASEQPFKSEVISNLTDGVSISTWMGLPAFATNKTWEFDYDGNLTFPDTTVQTTAWTGSVAYASVTGTPTLATVATSGSYADLSSKPTIYTSAYIGTTSLAFNRSSASQTLNGVSIDGSAATLTTARNINGVSFDGSANINVPRITDGTNTLKIVPAPSTLAGASGDLKGNIAFTDTYLYYCKTAYGGTSYVATASSGQTASYVNVRKSVAYTPAAGWTITFGTPLTISSVVDAGVVFGYDSWRLNLSTSVTSSGGTDYVLTDTSNAIWVQTPWNAITASGTDTLTNKTLTSPAVTTSLTTSSTTFALVDTTATTVNFAGAATTLNIGTSSGITNIASAVKVGTGTFTKAGYATGDLLLDNGGTDTPGLLMYYANNNNFAFDSWNGTFNILSGQLLRVVNNLNESGGAVKMAIDTSGNMVTTGFVQPSAWRAGQIIRDTMLSNTEFTVNATTVATSTTDTDFITYSYTPTSSSSYLIIHVHVAAYSAASDSGGAGTDSYFSRIKIGGNEIVYSRQMTRSNESFRTGALFPLTGRYTNSDVNAKTITVGVRRDSADDNITIVNSSTALWMRITEIAR